ncbi:MAG: T9SS type A sorting domain-containing protein [Bacteroidales bacterium]|nr:T9SS type A sorting domain-containing protein [Bacteroidales bacterium]
MKKILLLTIAILLFKTSFSQEEIKVLFLGNSYTYYNDLPKIIKDIAANEDKIFTYESVSPGGYTFFLHLEEQQGSLSKIRQGDWNYVVLQEQSQLPVIDYYRHNTFKPTYKALHDSIMLYNPEAKVIGYLTWGRRYGGQQCVNFGDGLYCSADFIDFNHMQDTLTAAYCENAYATNSYIAPVGEAWRAALTADPNLVLHISDNSHPTYEGSYLAACVFYSVFWNKSSVGIYHDKQIDDKKAELLQTISDEVFFNNLEKWNFKTDTVNITENFENKCYNIISNPSENKVIIENKSDSSINVKIFNVNGSLLNEKDINESDSLDLNNQKGIYIIQITESDSKHMYSEKIVKF